MELADELSAELAIGLATKRRGRKLRGGDAVALVERVQKILGELEVADRVRRLGGRRQNRTLKPVLQ